MFNVNFYSFAKDNNSTKRPSGDGVVFSCCIVEPSSIINPTIKIAAATFDYNYCYISDFSRYYFINDLVYNNGFWYASCNVDVLASYKNEIGNESLFIIRSSAAANGYIRDNFYPLTGEESADRYTIRAAQTNTFQSGVYVVNVMGNNTGSSTLYQFTPSAFNTFLSQLYTSLDGITWTDIPAAIKNLVFKPLDYINSVMWFPESFSASSASTIKIGPWESTGISAGIITNPVKKLSVTGNSPTVFKHPQASRGKYLNLSPYSRYQLVYPPFGIIPIDSTKIIDDSYFSIDCYVDALTGVGILTGSTAENGTDTLFQVTAQYGVQLPLLGNGNSGSAAGLLSSVAGVVAGVAAGQPELAIGSATAGIGTVAEAAIGSASTIGSNGSIVAHNLPRYFEATFLKVSNADNSKNGRPYMVDTKPKNLGGYMIVQHGDVPITGTAAEADEIRRVLESGFYYE